MSAPGSLAAADRLLRGGRSDEEVERLTQVTLEEIISLRAGLASGAFSSRRDRFSGRRLWSVSP